VKRPDPHLLAGAYVLQAVPAEDRTAYERHIARCAACAGELAELRETAGRLADDTWGTPPSGLRDRVMVRVLDTGRRRRRAPGGPAWLATLLRRARRPGG
jgi:anti-sigma factor RsiW